MPPPSQSEPATRQDLEVVAEQLEVHLSVFVDERLTGTERKLAAAVNSEMRAYAHTILLALLVGVLAISALIVVVPPAE